MNPLFIIHLAILNTFKKRLRVILAIVGIALTSGIIVGLFGVQSGLRNLVDTEIRNGQALDVVSINRRNVQELKLNQEKISAIKSISGVTDAAESVGLFGSASYHGILLNAPVYAVSQTYFAMNPSAISAGTTEAEPKTDSVIVSEKVLDVFGIEKGGAVGKKIKLNALLTKEYADNLKSDEFSTDEKEYTIRAVVNRGTLPVFYVNIEPFKEQGLTNVGQIDARLTSPDKSAEVREAVERLGFQTSSVQDTIEEINQLFEVIQNILVVFGIVVFVITVSSTFTVITLTLMEETKQIGFLRIMGLRHNDVTKLFVIQSIIVTFLGALLGCVFGIIGGFILNGYARVLAEGSTFSGEISVFLVPGLQVIIILTLSIVVGWLVGIIPARRAIRINPLEELQL